MKFIQQHEQRNLFVRIVKNIQFIDSKTECCFPEIVIRASGARQPIKVL